MLSEKFHYFNAPENFKKKYEKIINKLKVKVDKNIGVKTELVDELSDYFSMYNIVESNDTDSFKIDKDNSIIISTIRMGYGHYRIALALASVAASKGLKPYWFDIFSFDTKSTRYISNMESLYSIGSRFAHRHSWFNMLLWERATGKIYKNLNKILLNHNMALRLQDIFSVIPKEIPFLGTHSWVSQAAVYKGCNNVINVIHDNWPMSLFLADGCIQTIQGPSAFLGFRLFKDMYRHDLKPLPEGYFILTGHYVDQEIVVNIEKDCENRLRRAKNKEPRRFLISVGGAGAQDSIFIEIIRKLLPLIKENKVSLYINFGDHKKILNRVINSIPELKKVAVIHNDWNETKKFIKNIEENYNSGIHIFINDKIFPAIYTTNLLMRVVDFLITKPGELAFYPVPKINIKRLGAHEAWAAIRSSEIGDGTIELDNIPLILKALDLCIYEDNLLKDFCNNIINNNKNNIYSGAYRVIDIIMGNIGVNK